MLFTVGEQQALKHVGTRPVLPCRSEVKQALESFSNPETDGHGFFGGHGRHGLYRTSQYNQRQSRSTGVRIPEDRRAAALGIAVLPHDAAVGRPKRRANNQ